MAQIWADLRGLNTNTVPADDADLSRCTQIKYEQPFPQMAQIYAD